MNAATVAAALGRHTPKAGGGFMACCPAHDDNNPSLAIDESNGALLVRCFAGCEQSDVVAALKARNLWPGNSDPLPPNRKRPVRQVWRPVLPIPNDAPEPPAAHQRHGKPSQVWHYLSPDSALLQLVCRFDHADGSKDVLPLCYCTDGNRQDWRWQALPEPRPLYGLEQISAATHILISEGEKATDAARRLLGKGLPVVTWSGGSNATAKTDFSPLAGRKITIWPDNDEPGTKAALAVAKILEGIGCTVKIVKLPAGVKKGWDAADAELEGWTVSQVVELIEAASTHDQADDDGDDMTRCFVPLEDPEEAEHPHVVEYWFPVDEVTLLSGHGGCGKSIKMLVVAICVALGLKLGNLRTTQRNVLFFSAEDGRQTLQRRVKRICHLLNVDRSSLDGKLFLFDVSDADPTLYRGESQRPLLVRLAGLMVRFNIGFTIIDNASDVFDSKELDRARVRHFIRLLRSTLARPGRAVCLLAHVNKASANKSRDAGTEDYSGVTAWHNSCRSRLSLTTEKDGALKVEHPKANYGPKAQPMRFEWFGGVPMVSGTFDNRGGAAAADILAAEKRRQDEADKLAILGIMRDFDARGERITSAMQGSVTTYNLLKSCEGFPEDLPKDSFNRLIRDMETAGLIIRTNIKTADRKEREVFQVAPIPPGTEGTATDGQAEEVAA